MSNQYSVITRLRQHHVTILLAVVISWYCLTTLPYLSNFPIVETAQMGIAAPAYKLASQGIYGNDLYRGLYNVENYNYEYMPLYPLAVALSFKLLGLGVWQARLVSVVCGLALVLLTFRLGKTWAGADVGILAAIVLCLLPITVSSKNLNMMYTGRMPLLDMARVLRYDIMVPVWVLAATLSFHWAYRKRAIRANIGFLGTGLFTGLATLSHLYGTFILVVFFVLLLWQAGGKVVRQRPLYLILIGWSIAMLPWVVYVLQDVAAYQGQMLRHESRFDFLNPYFYLDNLSREQWRYVKFVGNLQAPLLWPRPGFWIMVGALVVATLSLWPRVRRQRQINGRFMFITLPLLMLLLATLMSFKRYAYVALLLPFLAIQVAYGILVAWRWARDRRLRLLQGFFLLLGLAGVLEGVAGAIDSYRAARGMTPYLDLTAALQEGIPEGARILMMHDFWLGMANHNVYSIDLAYNLSNPAFGGDEGATMAGVLQEMAPAYIIVPEHLLKLYITAPQSLPNEAVALMWQSLDEYIHRYCADEMVRFQDPAYGIVSTYRCETRPL